MLHYDRKDLKAKTYVVDFGLPVTIPVSAFGIEDASLQKIYAILFQKKISKGQRLTNWEADVLTDSQKKYAALDAWACLRIYNLLNQA